MTNIPPSNRQGNYRRMENSSTINYQQPPSRQAKQLILKRRAKVLAKISDNQGEITAHLNVTVFLLANVRYAIEMTHIRDVYALKEITPIPCTPSFLAGIVSIRGQILPVIDLKKFFNLPPQDQNELKHIIIIYTADTELGILADAIEGINSVPIIQIQSSFFAPTDIRGHYVKGITNQPLIILDPLKILTDQRITVNEEVEI